MKHFNSICIPLKYCSYSNLNFYNKSKFITILFYYSIIKKVLLFSSFSLLIFLFSCSEKSSETDTQNHYESIIHSISKQHFSIGDTIIIKGKNFGNESNNNYIVFGNNEAKEKDILFWSDTTIKVIINHAANGNSVYINKRVSNKYNYILYRPFWIECIDFLIKISLGITIIFLYLRINKIWKRKHDREVAESQSLIGLTIYIFNCILWVSYYAFVESDFKSLIDTSVYIFEGIIFFVIGTGFFVPDQRRLGLWRLIKRSLRIERREANYLLKKFFRPLNAEIIIGILHQLAWIDNEFDPKEKAFIEAFAKNWNIDYSSDSFYELNNETQDNRFIKLRKSVLDYLNREPPNEQVAQLKDTISTMIKVDSKISPQEKLISSEICPMLENYLSNDNKPNQYNVLIIPQYSEHEPIIEELFPDIKKIKISGGFAYPIGSYFSQEFANMICNEYRNMELFTIVFTPNDLKK